jgi:hypothetical protein
MNLVRLISTHTTNRQIFTPCSTALFTDTFFILRPNLELLSPVGDLPRSFPVMQYMLHNQLNNEYIFMC